MRLDRSTVEPGEVRVGQDVDGPWRPVRKARGDIAAGRVVTVGEPRPSRLGYWIVAPLPQWRQKKVRALVDALAS